MEHSESEVTVFRSADSLAEEDAAAVRELLVQDGIAATAVDDSVPDVPAGSWEVRVAAADAERAEAIIKANPVEDEMQDVDPSHDLDLVTVFESAGGGTSGEVEVMSVQAVLEADGIAAVVSAGPLPTMPREVRVAKDQAARARQLIQQAQAAGPAAADEAEAAVEIGRG
jgi:hypothetical protein